MRRYAVLFLCLLLVVGAVPSRAVSPPLTLAFSFSAVLGPHSATVRWLYTVPALRKATIDSVYLSIEQTTTSTNASTSTETILSYAPVSTGSFSSLGAAHLWSTTIVGAKEVLFAQGSVRMFAGDQLKGVTVNLRPDGTILHTIFVKITEEDAP